MSRPKKCIVCQERRPSQGYPGDKIAYHCAKCKLPGMEDIQKIRCIQCNKNTASHCLPTENKTNKTIEVVQLFYDI